MNMFLPLFPEISRYVTAEHSTLLGTVGGLSPRAITPASQRVEAFLLFQIKPVWNPDGSHNFVLTDRRLGQQIRDGFEVNAARNEITFTRFSELTRSGDDRTAYFFQLPPSFRGDLVRLRVGRRRGDGWGVGWV